MTCKDIIIKGYDGLYRIYENGDVFSLRNNRHLKPSINSCGYVQYFLTPNDKNKYKPRWFKAHRLVGIHFLDCPDNYGKLEINHINHNKLDNYYRNLEWCTHSDNIRKSYKNGGRKPYWEGKQKKPHSLETRLKMSDSKRKRVQRIDLSTGKVDIFESIQDLCENTEIYRKKFNRIINGGTIDKNFDYQIL